MMAAMRAATIDDGTIAVQDHPDPEPGPGEVLVRVRGAGPERRRHPPAQGRLPGAARLAGGHPRPRAGGRGRRGSAPAPSASPRATASWRSSAAAGRPSSRVVHERQLMPVPDGARLAAGGRHARGLHHRARRALHPGRAARRRAAARPRRGGRRRHGGGAARPRRRRARHRDGAQRRHCATRSSELGAARGHRPRGLRGARPVRRRARARRRAEHARGTSRRSTPLGRIVVIGVGAGFKAEVNLLALMGKRGTLRASTLRARPLEEKALTARRMERHVLPLFERGELACPVAETFALDQVDRRLRRASRPAASSARSS